MGGIWKLSYSAQRNTAFFSIFSNFCNRGIPPTGSYAKWHPTPWGSWKPRETRQAWKDGGAVQGNTFNDPSTISLRCAPYSRYNVVLIHWEVSENSRTAHKGTQLFFRIFLNANSTFRKVGFHQRVAIWYVTPHTMRPLETPGNMTAVEGWGEQCRVTLLTIRDSMCTIHGAWASYLWEKTPYNFVLWAKITFYP